MTISSEIQLRAIGILNAFRSDNPQSSVPSQGKGVDAIAFSAPSSTPHPSDHPDMRVDVAKFTRWLEHRVTRKVSSWIPARIDSASMFASMNEGSFIPVRYLTSAERYRSPLSHKRMGKM